MSILSSFPEHTLQPQIRQELDHRFSTFKAQLMQEVAAFREHTGTFKAHSMQQMDQLAQQDVSQIRAAKEQLKKSIENVDQPFEAVVKQLQQMGVAQCTTWAQSRQALECAIAEDGEACNKLQRRMQSLSQMLVPITQKIHAFAEQDVAEMEHSARNNQEAVRSIQAQIVQLEQEIAQFEHDKQVLQQSQQNVSQHLQGLQQKERALELRICHTERAIKHLEKRNKHLLLAAVGVIGGCCLAKWSLQQMISTSVSAASGRTATIKGGVRVGVQDRPPSHERHVKHQEPRDTHLKKGSLPPIQTLKAKQKDSREAHNNDYTLKELEGTQHNPQQNLKQILKGRPRTRIVRTINPTVGYLERVTEKDMEDSSNPHRDRAVNIVVGGASLTALGVLTEGVVPAIVGGVSLGSKFADQMLPPLEIYLQKHNYMEHDHKSAERCMESPEQCHPYYNALALKMTLEGVKSAAEAIDRALDVVAQPVKDLLDCAGVTDKRIGEACDALDKAMN